jgi:hypothetical protein
MRARKGAAAFNEQGIMVSSPIGRQPSGVACTNAEVRRGALSDSVLAVMSTTACLTTAAIDGEARCKSVVTDARVLQRWPPAGATKQEGARLHALTLLPARLESGYMAFLSFLHPHLFSHHFTHQSCGFCGPPAIW